MFIKDLIFQVEFSKYAERHFCKDFSKKYKGKQWSETLKTINNTLTRSFATMRETDLISLLKYNQDDDIGIFKFEFKVAGTNFSPKGSGNRVVFSLCNKTGLVKILLVYGKDDCSKKQQETAWILSHIKDNFPEYKKYCS